VDGAEITAKNPMEHYRAVIALIPMKGDTFNDRFVDPVRRESKFRNGEISDRSERHN